MNPQFNAARDTVVERSTPIHAAGATVSTLTTHDGHDYTQHVVLEVGDEPVTAREARELAAALLTAADQTDGRESQVLSTTP